VQITRDDGLIDVEQAAELCRVQTRTVHQWVARGHLVKAGIGERRGRNGRAYQISLFRPADVRRAEVKLRKPARRIILPRGA
jgi:DNA-binding transcriptional MerR regulator